MTTEALNVGVVGASGYTGFELIRFLSKHPRVKLKALSSARNSGKDIGEVHRAFAGVSGLKITGFDREFHKLDLVFVALPHGEAMPVVNELLNLPHGPRVVDLSSDFRLSAEEYLKHYGSAHLYPELLKHAIYGTPEICREEIQGARLVANPGCFAHCCILALAPLALGGILSETALIGAITGSTGSGASASDKTHHPARNESLSAYQVLSHRHAPEIENALKKAAGGGKVSIQLVPQSGPFSRGIFATCFVQTCAPAAKVKELYKDFARRNIFVRLRADTPRLLDVRGANFCDISVYQNGETVVALCAIDNLGKGAAGNAVQCMNIMFGIDEGSGLMELPWGI